MSKPNNLVYCSFCDKHQFEVYVIIAGRRGSFICDECVELCTDIVTKNKSASRAHLRDVLENGT